MYAGQVLLLLSLTVLTGCDLLTERVTGQPAPQEMDAQAIGYSCRVAKKTPEACIKENETYRPASILMGWRVADTEIHAEQLDPDMGNEPMKTSLALQREAEARSRAAKRQAAEQATEEEGAAEATPTEE